MRKLTKRRTTVSTELPTVTVFYMTPEKVCFRLYIFNDSLPLFKKTPMIFVCQEKDFHEIYQVINDGASAYKGIIPADRWHEPYMTEAELRRQMDEGVQFWSYLEDGRITGVMGIQMKDEVTLIRHAYVRTDKRKTGIGSGLLTHLSSIATTPVLIGTWADAHWAIQFYIKHGFRLLPQNEKNTLLRTYWTIPERQIETSVVLASSNWKM